MRKATHLTYLFASLFLLIVLSAQSATAQCAVVDQTFNVPENVREVDTGISISPGDTVTFSAAGNVWAGVWLTGQNGPAGWDNLQTAPNDYPLPGARIYSLLGRIDRGTPFYIGQGTELNMSAPGRLFLLINDNVPANGSGQFSSHIQVSRRPASFLIDQTITVPENVRGDVSTGITVLPGDRIQFQSTGSIWAGVWLTGQNGPDGWEAVNNDNSYPLPSARIYSLLGRLDGGYFYVGQNGEVRHSGSPSPLFLRINDNVPGNGSGQFTSRVRVERAGMPLSSTFSGPGRFTLNHPNTPNPFNRTISLPVEFSRDRCNLSIINFPPITETFDTHTFLGSNTTTITMIRGGTGSFDLTSGIISIPVTLRFSHSLATDGSSTCDLLLTTEANGGQRLSTGSATLVGSCRCEEGILDGSNATFVVTGSFSPGP
ncbi:MAG TPA: hypothetical protein VD861_07450 [Pyrinomonadaceae bacterium]|nr:hypothetical protein [Pyrinomonadaceae bacterium]